MCSENRSVPEIRENLTNRGKTIRSSPASTGIHQIFLGQKHEHPNRSPKRPCHSGEASVILAAFHSRLRFVGRATPAENSALPTRDRAHAVDVLTQGWVFTPRTAFMVNWCYWSAVALASRPWSGGETPIPCIPGASP